MFFYHVITLSDGLELQLPLELCFHCSSGYSFSRRNTLGCSPSLKGTAMTRKGIGKIEMEDSVPLSVKNLSASYPPKNVGSKFIDFFLIIIHVNQVAIHLQLSGSTRIHLIFQQLLLLHEELLCPLHSASVLPGPLP